MQVPIEMLEFFFMNVLIIQLTTEQRAVEECEYYEN